MAVRALASKPCQVVIVRIRPRASQVNQIRKLASLRGIGLSATPDIPRPRWVSVVGAEDRRTFGGVLDTSGSMDRILSAQSPHAYLVPQGRALPFVPKGLVFRLVA